MRKNRWVLVFALLYAVPLLAQDEFDAHLVGHVLDEKTGEHLPYVNVQVKGTNIGTVTDESGHYFLKNLPLGRQTIVFSYVGYETEELPVNISAHKTSELKAVIREVSQQLNSVVVNVITKEPVRNFVNLSNTSHVNEHAGYDIHPGHHLRPDDEPHSAGVCWNYSSSALKLPKIIRCHAGMTLEETAEGRRIGIAEMVTDLLDG